MLKTIVKHDLQNHIYSPRFILALVLTIFLFSISSISYLVEYKEQRNSFEQGMQKLKEYKKGIAENASQFAQYRNSLPIPPRNSGFITSCQEDNIPNTIIYSAFNVYGFEITKGDNNPFILPSQKVNWEFIIVFLFSFLAVVFTFDTISGEKESRTLTLGLSNPVSRGVLLFGKFLGTTIILSMFIFIGAILSLFIFLVSGQVSINMVTISEILGFILLSILLVACMTSIGILTSVLSYRPNTSLLIGLLLWLVFMFVIPHTTLLLSNKLFPVEKSDVISQNLQNSRSTIEAGFPDGKWHSDSGNPFEPDHKIRANMQMDFMLGEKKIKDAWYNSMFSQYQNTSRLTCVSPMFVFANCNEYIVDGGFQRFKKNWEDLHNYQTQFLNWFKAFDAKDKNSPHWYNPYEDYSSSKKPINIDDMPVYTEKVIPFSERLFNGRMYIALLLIYTSVVFFVSFVLFVRYDVR